MVHVLWFRHGQKLVDKTADKIRNQQASSGHYKFLSTLLNRQDLSYKDVSIITLSLFSDGLGTVCWPSVCRAFYISIFIHHFWQQVYRRLRA